ncbi:hypothetical protein PS467_06065 [Streptomyces luomodiensis]|uniref:Uncharacterized protein n=1 Tax=Streptomyces luomodiensis TaxID=3026192 RepID=A0ABY9UR23_9ACTN|nr:hypothetical protein [Streptomyces sp. SCA4-21]WNE94943.1 hypothetical protein PS467_06065 [Streptomyces sp. SCA4-21]
MSELTPNEQRHLTSLEEIANCPVLDADCGDTDRLTPPLEALPPLGAFNEKWADLVLDEDIRSCGLRFIDFGCRWSTRAGEDDEDDDVAYDDEEEAADNGILHTRELPEISGEFFLRPFHDILSQPDGPARGADTEFQRQFLSELRVMDQTPRSGAGMLTYIRLKPGLGPLEVWYSDVADIGASPYPPGFIKMDITYREYLDAILLTKGTYGWQYLYTDISLARGFGEIRGYLEGMLELFPEIFPDHDYSPLVERLEARL